MIPYDDLVVALATWRAKQGLPVGQMSAVLTPPVSAAPGAPASSTQSGSGPKRSGPPSGPPGAPPTPGKAPGSGRTAAPAPTPLPPSAETLDIDEHIVDEDAQLEGVDEFANAFSNIQADGAEGDEPTSIGSAPTPRDSFGGQTDPSPGPARTPNRNDDW